MTSYRLFGNQRVHVELDQGRGQAGVGDEREPRSHGQSA